jgi:hypothetical protein
MGAPDAVITGLTDTATGHYPWSSPLTEFCNNGGSACTASGTATTAGTDYIFFSVDRLASGTGTGCGTGSGNGCVLAYSINIPTNTPTLVGGLPETTLGTPGCWATGGLVIDNSVASGTQVGASEIYFISLNGYTAGGLSGSTSSNCTGAPFTPVTLNAVQAAQANP